MMGRNTLPVPDLWTDMLVDTRLSIKGIVHQKKENSLCFVDTQKPAWFVLVHQARAQLTIFDVLYVGLSALINLDMLLFVYDMFNLI